MTVDEQAKRYDLSGPVEYRGDAVLGTGTIWNVSASGALVERASTIVETGTPLRIRVSYYPGSFEIELPSEVVRTTSTGFAIRFTDLDESSRRLLARVLSRCQSEYDGVRPC
ncbi:MAG: PilZ domain-containing protein [Myxococcota bacterium]